MSKHENAKVSDWPQIPSQAWSRRMDAVLASPGKPVFPGLFDGGHLQGLPLGGIGTGGIGRDFYGGFSRWTIKAGALKHFCEPANFFAVYQAQEGQPGVARILYPDPAPETKTPVGYDGWRRDYPAKAASYHALFPKAWYHYQPLPDMPVELICEQFSPVIPGNYRESSLPVGMFVWKARNTSNKPVTLSLLFSFANMVGWFNDFAQDRPFTNRGGEIFNTPVDQRLDASATMTGIVFDREHACEFPPEGDGQFCIAAKAGPGVTITRYVGYHPPGKDARESFSTTGRLNSEGASHYCGSRTDLLGALAASVTLEPGETCEIPMALVWDLPVIEFSSRRRHFRRYTRYVGRDGKQAAAIAAEALQNYPQWSRQIDEWHRQVTQDGRPDWYYGMLFNEAYLLIDGYTAWTDGEVGGGDEEHFGIIECPDYPYYNTIDLWVYGSFLLLYYWPDIEKLVMRRLARLVAEDDPRPRMWLWKQERYPNKAAGAVPHDFGCPLDDPFFQSNAYNWQNPNVWRDLNAEFPLMVARDFAVTQDKAFLAECWPAVKLAMARQASYDADGDGLIENTGSPDQTFDNIPLIGPGAYCNSLWLGALAVSEKLAVTMNDTQAAQEFGRTLAKAKRAFDDRLWTGTHYRTDTQSKFKDTIFLEQLFGVWYAGLLGIDDLVPHEHAESSARVAYQQNYLNCPSSNIGALLFSGVSKNADAALQTKFNPDECQTHEALSGINMAFACHLQHAGMEEEAFKLLKTIHKVIYEDKGLWFRTPAAWNGNGDFRAIMNLRPLVIWAMEWDRNCSPKL